MVSLLQPGGAIGASSPSVHSHMNPLSNAASASDVGGASFAVTDSKTGDANYDLLSSSSSQQPSEELKDKLTKLLVSVFMHF